MSDPISPTPSVLGTYRASLLPIYERVCGDELSFDLLGDNFDEFLHAGMVGSALEQNLPRANTFARLLQTNADPETASDLFIDFLEQGHGCHETSPAGIAAAKAMVLERAADPKAVHVTNGHMAVPPMPLPPVWYQAPPLIAIPLRN